MNEATVRNNVVYGSGGGRDLLCDIYTAEGRAEPAPGVILLHGGGWRAGDRSVMEGYGRRLAAEGFVCVAPEYRLTPESPWPAQIHDVKAAIRWTRAQSAALGIDPERLAILGRSAGAHLALLAAGAANAPEFAGEGGNAGERADLAAVIAIFPPTVFYLGDDRAHGGTPANVLMGADATLDLAKAGSPLNYARAGFPPTFLLHGTADKIVPPSASMVMYQALAAAGVPVEMHLYAEQPHGFAGQPEFIDLCAAECAHFLRRYLIPVAALV